MHATQKTETFLVCKFCISGDNVYTDCVSISTLLHYSLFQYKSGDPMDDKPAPSTRLLTAWGIQAIPILLPFFIRRNVLWCLIHVLILSSLSCFKWLIVFCAIKTCWFFFFHLNVLLLVYRENLSLLLLKNFLDGHQRRWWGECTCRQPISLIS